MINTQYNFYKNFRKNINYITVQTQSSQTNQLNSRDKNNNNQIYSNTEYKVREFQWKCVCVWNIVLLPDSQIICSFSKPKQRTVKFKTHVVQNLTGTGEWI